MTTERRRMVSHHVDADGRESVSLNFKKWTGVLGFVGSVLGTSITIAGLVLAMLHPVVTRWIHEESEPVHIEMRASLAEVAENVAALKRASVSREELDARMARLESRLDDIYRLLAAGAPR